MIHHPVPSLTGEVRSEIVESGYPDLLAERVGSVDRWNDLAVRQTPTCQILGMCVSRPPVVGDGMNPALVATQVLTSGY
jgi:hypothetical protein